jgi:hypothetical protein
VCVRPFELAVSISTYVDGTLPLKLTVCGLPLALSVMASDALRVPVAVGVNVTLIAQLDPATTLLPQVFV